MLSSRNPLQIRSVRRTIVKIGYRANKRELNCNLPKDGRKRNLRKERGVTSDKMDKSIVVA
jgi:hypothetical protein